MPGRGNGTKCSRIAVTTRGATTGSAGRLCTARPCHSGHAECRPGATRRPTPSRAARNSSRAKKVAPKTGSSGSGVTAPIASTAHDAPSGGECLRSGAKLRQIPARNVWRSNPPARRDALGQAPCAKPSIGTPMWSESPRAATRRHRRRVFRQVVAPRADLWWVARRGGSVPVACLTPTYGGAAAIARCITP
jgi:hypothetical protein